MSDGPEWFAPRRYGLGSGYPISWQGWLVTVLFLASVAAIGIGLRHNVPQLAASLVAVTIVFMVISAKTTRGGWRWRWGGDEE